MPRRGLGLASDGYQGTAKRPLQHHVEIDVTAVDHREAGLDALGPDLFAAIAGERRSVAVVQREAAAPDGEMGALGRECGRDVGGVIG